MVPVDHFEPGDTQAAQAVQDLITQALRDRPELNESDVDLVNRQISGKAARNALLPSLALVGFYGGSGLAGPLNPIYNLPTPNSSNVAGLRASPQ